MPSQVTLQALQNLPLVQPGDDLAAIIIQATKQNQVRLCPGDILVLAQKIVSKAENRIIDLNTITAGQQAQELALTVDKDPRLVEVILRESRRVVRQAPGVLITEHNNGWTMANAGIDASNIDSSSDGNNVLLLPVDPDTSCRQLSTALGNALGLRLAVVINDSFGRPWRLGTTGVAIGSYGIPTLWDRRGECDLFGRELLTSQQAIADEVAAAASLLQGQAAEGQPVVVLSGLDYIGSTSSQPPQGKASDLIRCNQEDLFQ